MFYCIILKVHSTLLHTHTHHVYFRQYYIIKSHLAISSPDEFLVTVLVLRVTVLVLVLVLRRSVLVLRVTVLVLRRSVLVLVLPLPLVSWCHHWCLL